MPEHMQRFSKGLGVLKFPVGFGEAFSPIHDCHSAIPTAGPSTHPLTVKRVGWRGGPRSAPKQPALGGVAPDTISRDAYLLPSGAFGCTGRVQGMTTSCKMQNPVVSP